MCTACMKRNGTSVCSTRRSQLRKYRTELATKSTITQSNPLKEFLAIEIESIDNLLSNQDFCPTRQYINQYKLATDAKISEFN